jgi:hypothetical protein
VVRRSIRLGERRHARRAELSVVALLLIGCTEKSAGDPGTAVRDVYAALAARDCQKLMGGVAGAAEAQVRAVGCDKMFADHEAHGHVFQKVERVEADGRQRDEYLVTALLAAGGGGERSIVHRVGRRGDRYVVTALSKTSVSSAGVPAASGTSPTPPPPPPSEPVRSDPAPATVRPPPLPPLDQAQKEKLQARALEMIDEAITKTSDELTAARAAPDRDDDTIRKLEIRLERLRETRKIRATVVPK